MICSASNPEGCLMTVPVTRNVALLLFPDVEVLDFAGPFEVFSIAAQLTAEEAGGTAAFRVMTVADHAMIRAVGGLQVTPDHQLDDCPPADILLLPGGIGSRRAV